MKTLNQKLAGITKDGKEQRRLALLFHALRYQCGDPHIVKIYGVRTKSIFKQHRRAMDFLENRYQVDQSLPPDMKGETACLKFLQEIEGDS
jgi:hypothetical protein